MSRPGCRQDDHPSIGRRDLLQLGVLGLFGASLADLLRLEAEATPVGPGTASPRAKSVVFIFQSGGPSQHETFDPKPDAPEGIRGEYGTISTAIPGVRFCEYLPRLAARADRFSLVRTMHHTADRQFRNEHLSAMYMLHTGTTAIPAGDTNASIAVPRPGRIAWPSIGSMVSYADPGSNSSGLPDFVEIPRLNQMAYPGRGAGLLGPRHDPWGVDLAPACYTPDGGGSCPNCFSHDQPRDPARRPGKGPGAWWDNTNCRDATFRLPQFLSESLSFNRLEDHLSLRIKLDDVRRRLDLASDRGEHLAWDAHAERATRMLMGSRPGSQNPFDLSREHERTRELYGREEWGNAFLTARRLIEAGVRMVQVNLRGWDTHQNAFRDLKGSLLPSLDRCLSGFLDDLTSRGLLDETLVVMCGEMGRTPIISPISATGRNTAGEPFSPGRHHWGDVFPCFFAGGGIRPGHIVGNTDRQGGSPATEAYTPADLAATIFHVLGVPGDAEFRDRSDRPYRVYLGSPIAPLLS